MGVKGLFKDLFFFTSDAEGDIYQHCKFPAEVLVLW